MDGYFFAIAAMAIPFVSMPFIPIIGRWSSKARAWFAVSVGLLTAVFAALLIPSVQSVHSYQAQTFEWIPGFSITVSVYLDGLSVFIANIAAFIGFLVLLFSVKYMQHAEQEGYSLSRYYVLTLLFIGGMIGLALTSNLLVLYIFWEVVGFCSYALIAYYYKDPKALRGGTKAFVVTRIGDIGFFIAVLVLWHSYGTFDLRVIIESIQSGVVHPYLWIAGAGVILGAIGKSAQIPLHVWLPDAMEAPTTITALIHAATMVNAGVYLVARTFPVFGHYSWWLISLAWIGAATALFAALLACAEKDIKRVLAYSTISQLGYMVSAVGLGALLASQFHLLSHAIFKALLFLGAGTVIHTLGTRNMYEMGGLRKEMKITNATFLVGILALMGIPVLNGFWSKDLIIDSALKAGSWGPLVLLTLTAFLTILYSWRMYWLTFMGEKRNRKEAHDPPWEMSVPLVLLAIGALTSWIAIGQYSVRMGQTLFSGMEFLDLAHLVQEVLLTPIIAVAGVSVVLVLYLATVYRSKIEAVFRGESHSAMALRSGLGFDWVYLRIVRGIRGAGNRLRTTQTGDLNYNSLGIGLGILLMFLIFWLVKKGVMG